MILMWSCQGNMPKYYPGLRHITPPFGRVICLSDLGNIIQLLTFNESTSTHDYTDLVNE